MSRTFLCSSIWSCFLGFPSIASVRNDFLTSLPFIISKVRISKMTNGTHFFETKLQNAKILPPGRLFKHRWQNHVHILFGRYNDEFGKAGSLLTSWQLRWCSGTRGTNWDIRSWASFIKSTPCSFMIKPGRWDRSVDHHPFPDDAFVSQSAGGFCAALNWWPADRGWL